MLSSIKPEDETLIHMDTKRAFVEPALLMPAIKMLLIADIAGIYVERQAKPTLLRTQPNPSLYLLVWRRGTISVCFCQAFHDLLLA